MKFTRTINANGVSVVDSINVNIGFTYNSGEAPLSVSFSFTTVNGATVSGTCDAEKITNYSVYQGIVTDELLKLVETECKRVLTNYETV